MENLNLALRNGTATIRVNGRNRPRTIERLQEYQDNYGDFEHFKQVGIHYVEDTAVRALEYRYSLPNSTEEDESKIMPLHTKRVICSEVFQNNYFSKEEFQNFEAAHDDLLFLHVNIRGIRTNFKKLKQFIKPLGDIHFPDVICVSETKNPNNIKRFALSSYFSPAKSTTRKNSGGSVAVYVKKTLFNAILLEGDCLDFPGCESVWVEFGKENKRVVVGCLYVHGSLKRATYTNLVMKLKAIIREFNNNQKKVYILGDFNVNMLNPKIKSQNLADAFHDVECKLLITKPTRVYGDTKTLIDHIYTNDETNQIVRAGVVETKDVSDHYPVFCIAKWSHLNEPNYKIIKKLNIIEQKLDKLNVSSV